MLRTLWGNDERYRQVYWSKFPGLYFPGDGALRDADGNFWLLGRVDDVMLVAGHNISTMEMESALVEHPLVAEAAVIGKTHEIKGQAPVAFVIIREGHGPDPHDKAAILALGTELKEFVGKETGRDLPPRRRDPDRRPAQDPQRQNHAPLAARHRRGPRDGRHHHARRPRHRRQPQRQVRGRRKLTP